MRLLLLAIFASACSGSGKPEPISPPSPVTAPTGEAPAASHTACAAAEDCVIVETACCDHCNGGKAEAINKAFATQHKPAGCESTACTMRACGQAVATCETGVCATTIQPL